MLLLQQNLQPYNVSATQAGSWSLANFATGSQAGSWSVAGVMFASGTQPGAWSVANFATGTQAGSWSVANFATGSVSGAWSVANYASAAQAGSWSIVSYANATQASAWSVAGFAIGDQSGAWSISAYVEGTQAGAWSVDAAVEVASRAGFEMGGIPIVSFKPLLQRIKEARAERIKPVKKSARRKARVIEGQAVDLVLSGGGESAFNELMQQWVAQAPVLPAQPTMNLEQLFMAQVAMHIRRIEQQDEDDALIALLIA